mmetsp:Transcript_99453/g.148933  ORF Transcript_99453/g.148933 Transcript_99453/m.148933 type:complete len:85 (-) Transcript_99453:316-570(-)
MCPYSESRIPANRNSQRLQEKRHARIFVADMETRKSAGQAMIQHMSMRQEKIGHFPDGSWHGKIRISEVLDSAHSLPLGYFVGH